MLLHIGTPGPGSGLLPLDPKSTLFFHSQYMEFEQYHFGLADVAGYWAEDVSFYLNEVNPVPKPVSMGLAHSND